MALIFNGTDNNVSIPAIQGGTGGTSTGVYYPSANAIAIATGGVNALTISNTQAITFSGAVTQTGNAAFSANVSVAGSVNALNTFGFENRIINGNMTIDQRNAGASVTPTSGTYSVDRFKVFCSQSSKLSFQQNAGSVTPPTGFTNYLGITSLSAYSVTSTDEFGIYQAIEGYNMADFAWGTANAKTVTLSFWVRSSLTGTFGGSLRNSATNRSYPYSYTISVANTWEQKSVTIAGDTSGTWLTTNGAGIYLSFNLGAGSTLVTTANAWAAENYLAPTGATSVVGTNGATFYITGVQLEVGSQATSFDFRGIGAELALCQRYYEVGSFTQRAYGGSAYCGQFFPFAVTKRTGPSMAASGTSYPYNASGMDLVGGYTSGFEMYVYTSGPYAVSSSWAASAEL
jgi:hypothetical protein